MYRGQSNGAESNTYVREKSQIDTARATHTKLIEAGAKPEVGGVKEQSQASGDNLSIKRVKVFRDHLSFLTATSFRCEITRSCITDGSP